MLVDWRIYTWYCPNCKEEVAGLKNKKNQIKVKCSRCGAEMIRTVVGRRHDVIDIYVVPCDFDLEGTVLEGAKIEALKNKLAQWKTWGVEMLELYLSGKKEQATFIISEEYGVSTRQVQRWKSLFESYVKRFFEKF